MMRPDVDTDLFHRMCKVLREGTGEVVGQAARNSLEIYTSPEYGALEQRMLFQRMPLLFGFGCDVAEAGDLLTDDQFDIPVLIVRMADGSVRAFVNAPDRSGIGAPAGRRQDRHDPDALAQATAGLAPLGVVERHGMLWVWIDPADAAAGDPARAEAELEAHLGPLGPRLETYGFAGYHHYETRTH